MTGGWRDRLCGWPKKSPDPQEGVVPAETADRDYGTWPNPAANPSDKVLGGKVEVRTLRVQQEIDADKAAREADHADLARLSTSLIAIAEGSVARSRAGAEAVAKASASIATLYTGVLALSFSVAENPLPLRGVVPALFLGGAVVLSTAYLAYGRTNKETAHGLPFGPIPRMPNLSRRSLWRYGVVSLVAGDLVKRRQSALRASVVSLGIGLATLPLPFISLGNPVEPAWPSASLGEGENLELAKIRYTAEVQRAAEQAGTVEQAAWLEYAVAGGALALGVIAVLATMFFTDAQESGTEQDGSQDSDATVEKA